MPKYPRVLLPDTHARVHKKEALTQRIENVSEQATLALESAITEQLEFGVTELLESALSEITAVPLSSLVLMSDEELEELGLGDFFKKAVKKAKDIGSSAVKTVSKVTRSIVSEVSDVFKSPSKSSSSSTYKPPTTSSKVESTSTKKKGDSLFGEILKSVKNVGEEIRDAFDPGAAGLGEGDGTGGRWEENEHPRGPDGKFIEKPSKAKKIDKKDAPHLNDLLNEDQYHLEKSFTFDPHTAYSYESDKGNGTLYLYDSVPGGTTMNKDMIMSILDQLQADYKGKVRPTSIVIGDNNTDASNVGAWVYNNFGEGDEKVSPYIFINQTGFNNIAGKKGNDKSTAQQEDGYNPKLGVNVKGNPDNGTEFMPPFGKSYESNAKYLMSHEFGHRYDNENGNHNSGGRLWYDSENQKNLSQYGNSSAGEGYAEAFAQWNMTKGNTRNLTTITYGINEKWAGGENFWTGRGLLPGFGGDSDLAPEFSLTVNTDSDTHEFAKKKVTTMDGRIFSCTGFDLDITMTNLPPAPEVTDEDLAEMASERDQIKKALRTKKK